jgi:AraC family transcriptional regulator of arabinose operon
MGSTGGALATRAAGPAAAPRGRPQAVALQRLTLAEGSALMQQHLACAAGALQVRDPGAEPSAAPMQAAGPWDFTRPHHHAQPEVALCLEGHCLLVGAWGAMRLGPYECCILPPFVDHDERCAERTQPYTLLWTSVSHGAAELCLTAYRPDGPPFFLVREQVRVLHADVRLFVQAAAEAQARHQGWDQAAADYLRAFYRWLSRSSWSMRGHASELVTAVLEFVEEHCQGPLTPAQVAAAWHMEERRLRRLVKQHTGMSLAACITAARMERALRLLAAGGLSVHEVARRSGYRDALYFSRMVKKWAGAAPSRVARQSGGPWRTAANEATLDAWRGRAWACPPDAGH